MSRYIFLILILGFVGGGHSKSQANSDVNILQSHVSVNTHGSTVRGYLVVNGDYQSGYKILIKGGGVGDLPSYGWRFYKWSNLLQRENYCYDNNSKKHYIGKLEIQKSWWSNNDKYIDSDTLYYGGTDITWEFDIPASSWGRWDCYGNIVGDIFIGDNHESSTIATILGVFHIILPKPPTTITIMPTTVNLKGLVNKIEKTKVTISVNNPSGNTQIITATRNAGGDSNVKICFATDCQNLNTQKDIFESITTTGGDVNVEIGAISKKATDTTISLTVTVTTQ
ncbi:hypothetical protein JNB13_24725 [Escherichia coli]|uniref:hypothetical protein n=1 Tax=Escherichia coli TaxID=562 RepID=UPI00192D919B|nr:hypothetical protein [Escherichia coli]MBL6305619.1 hypothetical protein [Escherichia coli]MBL6395305.1 hypothetical protein [Escherichia coli]